MIANIHEGPIEIGQLRELEMASGLNYRPIGDLWLRGDADLGGSPSGFEGRLIDVFGDLRFDFGLGTTDVGPIAEVLMPPKVDEKGRMRTMIEGHGSPASLKAIGPVDDVVLQAVGQGLTLDFFPEPAWALDDVEVYKNAIDDFAIRNPFLKDEAQLTYVGMTDFGQKRQIGVPMVVNEVQDGEFKTLFVGSVE